MTKERRPLLLPSIAILCGMIACSICMLRHSAHHSAFTLAFYGLLLANSYIQFTLASKRRTPSPLISLFPESPATTKEDPNL